MKVLIIGNLGYVGPVVVRYLRARHPHWTLVGLDSGLFADCLTTAEGLPERYLSSQIFADVRDVSPDLFAGVNAVVQLAAISNDPMGVRYEAPTVEINHKAALACAEMAAAAGVKNFVFASSCSVYGAAGAVARTEADVTNPLTAYARSKVETERLLQGRHLPMTVTCLRFATACGMSGRLRLDLVLNDFAACALANRRIDILSDGTPWRPLIDVEDMARAIDWAVERERDAGGPFLVVNTGSNRWNYMVRDLAEAVSRQAGETGSDVAVSVAADGQPDKRSYRVDFSLFERLAPGHTPRIELDESIGRLLSGLKSFGFADTNFRTSRLIRLRVLDAHMKAGRLSPSVRWM